MKRWRWLLLAALACTPELEPIVWEPVDIEALRQAIAQPTGIVDEASAKQVGAAIVQRSEPYRVLAAYLHSVFEQPEQRSSRPPWVAPQALAGTSVYLLVACPGPLAGEGEPFTHGSMRIDSPTLSEEVISTFAVRGQLRLSFAACEIEEFVFEGVARAFHDSEAGELGLVPELSVAWLLEGLGEGSPEGWGEGAPEGLGAVEQSYQLREPMLWNAADRVSVLFELISGETLVLDLYAAAHELRLRGSNGELICTVADGSLDCVPP